MKIKKLTKTKKIKAYADIGCHGGIFMFHGGDIAKKYPTLLHIHLEKVSEDLTPVTITYKVKNK